jgi:hypothetical protein
MKKSIFKVRVNTILLQIHRGFMPDGSEDYTDKEILANIPDNGLSPKYNPGGDTTSLVSKPFTYKWVSKRLKKDPTVTSFSLLVEAGFKDKEDTPD